MFRDAAPPLKVKDGKSILAFYPVRPNTDIKLAVTWDLMDEGVTHGAPVSTPRAEDLKEVFAWHSVDRVPARWRGVSPSIKLLICIRLGHSQSIRRGMRGGGWLQLTVGVAKVLSYHRMHPCSH